MGDPKFSRRSYDTPTHPWQAARIREEDVIVKRFGLSKKKELWKAQSLIRKWRGQARSLIARSRYGEKQAERETEELLGRVARLGILPEGASLDNILALQADAILLRRLQTVAYLRGLAYTPKHARQLIVHGHIAIKDRRVTVPGFYVTRDDEIEVSYHAFSPMTNDLHPARPDPEDIQQRIEAREQEAARKLEALKEEGTRRRRGRKPPQRGPPRPGVPTGGSAARRAPYVPVKRKV